MLLELPIPKFQNNPNNIPNVAFHLINHSAKRTNIATLLWMDLIDTDMLPTLDEVTRKVLKPILEDIRSLNLNCYKKCKAAVLSQQLTSGKYLRVDSVTNMSDLVRQWASDPLCDLTTSVPEWMHLTVKPLSMIIDNALDNARAHGERNTNYSLNMSYNGERLLIEIKNKAGTNHEKVVSRKAEKQLTPSHTSQAQ